MSLRARVATCSATRVGAGRSLGDECYPLWLAAAMCISRFGPTWLSSAFVADKRPRLVAALVHIVVPDQT